MADNVTDPLVKRLLRKHHREGGGAVTDGAGTAATDNEGATSAGGNSVFKGYRATARCPTAAFATGLHIIGA
jgi:hypothetical protein